MSALLTLAVLALPALAAAATGLAPDRRGVGVDGARHVRRRLGGVGQCGPGVGTHGQEDLSGGHAGRTQQRTDLPDLVLGGHGHDGAHGAGAGGPARAVHIRLVLGRRVRVDDQSHVVDVDAARGDVGGHQHGRLTRGERVEVPHAGVLRQVAVQIHAGHPAAGELLGQALGTVLGAGEHHGPLVGAGQVGQGAHAVVGIHAQDVVRGRAGGGGAVVDGVVDGIHEEPVHELAHALVEGGGEQQTLRALRGGRQDPGDTGQEAQVRHVVRLVEHGDLRLVQAAVLLTHEVLEPAGAGHHDVHTAVQGLDLAALADTAEDHGRAHAHRLRQRREGLVDLAGQLTGRGEDEPARRTLGPATTGGGQAGDERDAEGVGLTRAGPAAAQHVAPVQGVGQGGVLDGRGGDDARVTEDAEQGGRNAEIGERT